MDRADTSDSVCGHPDSPDEARLNEILAELAAVETSAEETFSDARVAETIRVLCTRRLDAVAYPAVHLTVTETSERVEDLVIERLLVTATGLSTEGVLDPLGVTVLSRSDVGAWTSFLLSLVARGLHGIRVVTSPASAGVDEAVAIVLPEAAWHEGAPDWFPRPAG